MTIQLSENYPKLIKDLFLYDVGEEHYPNKALTCEQIVDQISYMPLDLGMFNDYKAILKEAIELPYKESKSDADRCYMYGPVGTDDPQCELVNSSDTEFEYKIKMDTCPAIKHFIDRMCEIGQVTYISFKRMLPKHFINPHIDSKCNPFKVYIPLTWPNGNYFKMYKKGLIPFAPAVPFLVNTGNNMHSVINDSDEVRYIFSFYADWSTYGWQRIIQDSYKKLINDIY
jgi:hypothetical protein